MKVRKDDKGLYIKNARGDGPYRPGGIIGYDANILTGGFGANFLGIGGNTEYRRDNVSVYVRAVSIARKMLSDPPEVKVPPARSPPPSSARDMAITSSSSDFSEG